MAIIRTCFLLLIFCGHQCAAFLLKRTKSDSTNQDITIENQKIRPDLDSEDGCGANPLTAIEQPKAVWGKDPMSKLNDKLLSMEEGRGVWVEILDTHRGEPKSMCARMYICLQRLQVPDWASPDLRSFYLKRFQCQKEGGNETVQEWSGNDLRDAAGRQGFAFKLDMNTNLGEDRPRIELEGLFTASLRSDKGVPVHGRDLVQLLQAIVDSVDTYKSIYLYTRDSSSYNFWYSKCRFLFLDFGDSPYRRMIWTKPVYDDDYY